MAIFKIYVIKMAMTLPCDFNRSYIFILFYIARPYIIIIGIPNYISEWNYQTTLRNSYFLCFSPEKIDQRGRSWSCAFETDPNTPQPSCIGNAKILIWLITKIVLNCDS